MRVGLCEVVGTDLDRAGLVDALQDDAALVGIDLGDLPALAVVDVGFAVVDSGDDLVAGGKARFADLDLLLAELPGLSAQLAGHRVQAFDLDVLLGDHHRVLSGPKGLMPLGEHRLAAGLGIGGHNYPLLRAVEVKGLGSFAFADQPRPFALDL
jgi:hypothetical protein